MNKNGFRSAEPSAPLTFLLGILIALSALGTDLYVPALPDVAARFGAPVSAVQLTLTTYFAGLAAGQLVWGPLSDRHGRKPVLLVALALMLGFTAAAPFVPTVGALATVRLAQGFAMAGGVVVARSIVRDLHAHEQAARLLARMMVVFSMVPIAAPIVGAALVARGGWQAIQWALAAVAAGLLLAVAAGLRETAPAGRSSAQSFAALGTVLADRRFLLPLALFLSCQVGILAWVAGSAFTLAALGISVDAYGWIFAGVMLGQIGGAWMASRFVLRLGMARMLRGGAWTVFVSGGTVAALAWAGAAHWAAIAAPFCLLILGTALVIPSATSLALSPFPQAAGAAASLLGAIGFANGAVISTMLGGMFDGTARPMATFALLSGCGVLACERLLARGQG